MASTSHHHSYTSPPNPLRPYYIPPAQNFDAAPASAPAPPPLPSSFQAPSSYDIIQDVMDYSEDYIDSPSVGEAMRGFLDQAILKYTSILISQPFEVAKTVLQCQYVPRGDIKIKREPRQMGATAAEEEEMSESGDEGTKEADPEDNPWSNLEGDDAEDSDDEPKYFATESPEASPQLRPTKTTMAPATGPKKMTDRSGYVMEDKEIAPRPDYQIRKLNSSGAVNEALKALWAKEGAWGIWKGTNATFIYQVLVSTGEAWTTSFLSAILSLPDPGVSDISDSTHPMASLAVAVSASIITAVLLSPLDIIRTKLILTPSTSKPRNLLPSLRALPSYTIPSSLVLPTVLYAAIPSFITLSTPFFLKTKLNLDPLLTPASFNFMTFLASTAEMIVRLPLETVLRRAQIAEAKPERTIVPVGRYAGVVGTAWVLMKEEERGKWGFEGLYRGWRVMAWSNAGVLGLGMLGVQGGSHEF